MDAQKKKITLATAERIRHFRKDRGLSQEALALKANLNPAYFGQIERGAKCPTVDTLYKISTALELPLPELLRFDRRPAGAGGGLSKTLAGAAGADPQAQRGRFHPPVRVSHRHAGLRGRRESKKNLREQGPKDSAPAVVLFYCNFVLAPAHRCFFSRRISFPKKAMSRYSP